jgi:hypothetical protein
VRPPFGRRGGTRCGGRGRLVGAADGARALDDAVALWRAATMTASRANLLTKDAPAEDRANSAKIAHCLSWSGMRGQPVWSRSSHLSPPHPPGSPAVPLAARCGFTPPAPTNGQKLDQVGPPARVPVSSAYVRASGGPRRSTRRSGRRRASRRLPPPPRQRACCFHLLQSPPCGR